MVDSGFLGLTNVVAAKGGSVQLGKHEVEGITRDLTGIFTWVVSHESIHSVLDS